MKLGIHLVHPSLLKSLIDLEIPNAEEKDSKNVSTENDHDDKSDQFY